MLSSSPFLSCPYTRNLFFILYGNFYSMAGERNIHLFYSLSSFILFYLKLSGSCLEVGEFTTVR